MVQGRYQLCMSDMPVSKKHLLRKAFFIGNNRFLINTYIFFIIKDGDRLKKPSVSTSLKE
jgi:hypothetical protein